MAAEARDDHPGDRPRTFQEVADVARGTDGVPDDLLRALWEDATGAPGDQLSSLPSDATYRFTFIRGLEREELPTSIPPTSFRLLEEIGRGGTGTVFRAWQEDLDREVALKKLHGKRSSTRQGRKSFLAEAVTVGRLEHPNIVPVYALDSDDEEGLSLAMKLVAGESWCESLHRDEPWEDPDGAVLARHLEILLQVGNAVAFAHSRAIVHNDLKPSNVMIGEFGEVVVLDWGLAVDIAEGDRRRERLHHRSRIRRPCGTPAYMPPELARGDGDAIGVWTDVYLLGASLYEILTGVPPHRGGLLESARQALEPVEPAFPAHVPSALAALCMRALALAPEDRFPSVPVFQEELRTFLRHRESLTIAHRASAALDTLSARTWSGKPARRAVLELYEGFAATVADFRQARTLWASNRRAAEGELAAREAWAHTALRLGDLQLAETQAARLEEEGASAAQEVRAALDTAYDRRRAAERSRRRLRGGLIAALVVAFCGLTLGLVELWRHSASIEEANRRIADKNREVEAALAALEEQREATAARGSIAEDALDALAHEVRVQLIDEGGDARSHRVARAVLDTALRGWQRLRDSHQGADQASLGAARARMQVAELARTVDGDLVRARAELDSAVLILRALDPAERDTRVALAEALTQRSQVDALYQSALEPLRSALASAREAETLARGLVADGEVEARGTLAAALDARGDALVALGAAVPTWEEDSEAAYEESLGLRRALLAEHPEDEAALRALSESLLRVAIQLDTRGESSRAEELLAEMVATESAALERDPTNTRTRRRTSVALLELGRTVQAQGRVEDASELFRQSVVLRRALFHQYPESRRRQQDLDAALRAYGEHLWGQGLRKSALPIYQELLALRERLTPLRDADENRAALIPALRWLARLEASVGEVEAAHEHYREMLSLLRDGRGPDAERALGMGLAEAGKLEEIREDLLAAEQRYVEAEELLLRVLARDPEDEQAARFLPLVRTWLADVGRGGLARKSRLYAQAYADCLARYEADRDDDDALWDLTQAARQLAWVRLNEGRPEESLELARAAVRGVRELGRRAGGPDQTNASELVYALQLEADALQALGDLDGSLDPLHEALDLAILEAEAMPDDPYAQRTVLPVLSRLGLLSRKLQRWEDTVTYDAEQLRRARAIARRFPDREARRAVARALGNLATTELARGRLADARTALDEAREILDELLDTAPSDLGLLEDRAFLLRNLGSWHVADGTPAQALDLLAESDSLFARLLDASPSDTSLLLDRLNVLEEWDAGLVTAGNMTASKRVAMRALHVALELARVDSSEPAQCAPGISHMAVAAACERLGDLDGAIEHAAAALRFHQAVPHDSERVRGGLELIRAELARLRALREPSRD